MKPLAIAAVLASALTMTGCGMGTIGDLEEQLHSTWANAEYQYEVRSDLVPDLVGVIKAHAAKHELDYPAELEAVVEARAHVGTAQINFRGVMLDNPKSMTMFLEAQTELNQALSALDLAIAQWSELPGDQEYQAIRGRLETRSQQTAEARKAFEKVAVAYNRELKNSAWKEILYSELQPVTLPAKT